VGPRFSGKVREEPQRRARERRKNSETKASTVRKPMPDAPVMETVKEAYRLSSHPFQPSQGEKGKQDHPRAMASLLDPAEGLTDNGRGTCRRFSGKPKEGG